MRWSGPRAGEAVLVTGASSGLGRALALEMAHAGWALVLAGRDTVRLESAAADCRRRGSPSVATVRADLAQPDGVESLVRQAKALGSPVAGLVNNAGAGRAGSWAEGSLEDDRALVRLLVDAPLALTRAWLPAWRSAGGGAVLNVASTGAFQPGPETAVYYAAKAFLMSWSLALAQEEGEWLTVTTLCPGALATGFAAAAGKRDVAGAPGPDATARVALRAWKKGRGLVVPGALNKAMVAASRLLPPAWTARAVQAVQRSVQLPSSRPGG